MARKKRKKKRPHEWWLPFLAESDQELERGRFIYNEITGESGDDKCFKTLIQVRDHVMNLAKELKENGDDERWLFYASVFVGVGQLLRERIELYQEAPNDD